MTARRSELPPLSDGPARPETNPVLQVAYEAHHGKLLRFARRMSRDDDLAADLVHEAFLRLVREVQADRTPDRIGAWLFRVVRNLAISDIRRRKSLEKACAYLKVEDAADAPEMTALEREREGWLRAAFSRLNADQRTALHFAASGLTGREAARAMGRSECATRAMLWRARNRLRRDFAAFGAS